MKYVIYGEEGQYCTQSHEEEVESVGTPLALTRLANKYANEWGRYGDNWQGFQKAKIAIFKGTLDEFKAQYSKISAPHYITGCTYRVDVFGDEYCDNEYKALNF